MVQSTPVKPLTYMYATRYLNLLTHNIKRRPLSYEEKESLSKNTMYTQSIRNSGTEEIIPRLSCMVCLNHHNLHC